VPEASQQGAGFPDRPSFYQGPDKENGFFSIMRYILYKKLHASSAPPDMKNVPRFY
jgi:hypothetical protein